jgi:hypothetical protein
MGIARAIITMLMLVFLVTSGMLIVPSGRADQLVLKVFTISLSLLVGVGLGILWTGGF